MQPYYKEGGNYREGGSRPQTGTVSPTNDDTMTVCAIRLLSAMLADLLHEGMGHGALALIAALTFMTIS